MSPPRPGSAILACFTFGWIAGCAGPSSAIPDASNDNPIPGFAVCPSLRPTATEAGSCTTADGGSIDNVTLPSGCEGLPGDGGASFDTTVFDGQPSVMVDDDDCKYRIAFTRACSPKSPEMSFLVKVTKRAGGAQATGATPSIVAYQGLAHPAPNVNTVATELEPGIYSISPVRFDRAGTWTLELHVYEHCPYGPGSPHGHATFEFDLAP